MIRKMRYPIGNANDENSLVKKNVFGPITNANNENSLVNNIASRFPLTYKP